MSGKMEAAADGAKRAAFLRRKTNETDIRIGLDLDGRMAGTGEGAPVGRAIDVRTGIGFLDHLLTALARHAGWSLDLKCAGDLEVDDHHSAEDCAIALGAAIAEAAKGGGIRRFGYAYAPLDEALARAVVDFSGRPWCEARLRLSAGRIGTLACENVPHVLRSLASGAGITLHVDVLRGENDHHKAEAAFKALALALRDALEPMRGETGAPSTKGDVEVGSIAQRDSEARDGD